MKLQNSGAITSTQAIILIINYILGVGILTLPRTAAAEVGTPDIWLTVLISSVFPIWIGLIIIKLNNRFPGKTFFQYNHLIIGKFLSIVLGLFIILYFMVLTSFELRVMAEVTEMYLLEGTPIEILIVIYIWLSVYLIVGGISSIARLFQIIFPITVFIFILIAFMSLGLFEVNHLRPVLGDGIIPVLKGIKTTSLSFIGIEILLILSAYLIKPRDGNYVVLWGVLLPTIFYVITVVVVIGALSVEGVNNLTWPTISLIRSFEFPGIIFERYDSLFLIIWIMQMYATSTITIFAAALGLSHLFNKRFTTFMYSLLPFIYIFSMVPKNLHDIFFVGDMLGEAAIVLFGITPLLLLAITKIRGNR
ncbi:GerAB/ArcD/ProY family transporter [Alkalihalobacillus sp. BA299]|uniref:GerAB/ArcD/ProY family transporter n=1 Tax=Alkalihalobacillus sp. BA299 TaxID=2815938 RepID=UPI001ADBDA81|nr:GerAB/ArcD/ProY family transporter [Alkalihalobacillus sp. BA299]